MSNFYLGIDVSKGYADFMMLDSEKQETIKPIQLDDTFTGHEKLASYLNNFLKEQPDDEVFAAVESTGGYENNWVKLLTDLSDILPIHVARLNPARVKYNSQADAKHNNTDTISAKNIAEYLIAHPEKVNYQKPKQDYPHLRRMWNFIRLNVKQKTQLLNHLESVLYTAMPELLRFCRNGVPDWLLHVLKKYSTYQQLIGAGVEKLSQTPYISTSKAEKLLKLLQQGVGESNTISGQIIGTLATQILTLQKHIKEQKKFLENNYQEAKQEVELLTTYNGIGVYSAVGLLLNIGSVELFRTSKNLASFWGLHPVYKESGDGKWGFRMSKSGRGEPRAILYNVARSAVLYNPVIKELYARCMKKGMVYHAAIGVCMHKTMRIIYGMLKNKTAFDPKIDKNNQLKYQSKKTNHKPLKKRTLQEFDENAPISSRQHKKRKKQAQSQDEIFSPCTGSESLLLPSN